MCNTYIEKPPKIEGYQFDGANGEEIIEWLGGPDYGVVSGETLVLTPQGKDPRGVKVTVSRGQFVVTSKVGTRVVNEGEFVGAFANEDGSDIVSLPPPPPPEPPVADEELVYEPGFGPLTEEDKKKSEERAKKLAEERAKKLEKKPEEKHKVEPHKPEPHKHEPVGHR